MKYLAVRAGIVLALLAVQSSSATPQAPSLDSARRALASGDGAGALALYEALTQQGENLEAEIGMVRAALLAGEFRKAMSWATLTAGEHKDSAEAVALLAYLHDRVGHTEQALADLKALPDSAVVAGARAEILSSRMGAGQKSSSGAWPRPAFERFPVSEERVISAGNGLIVEGGARVLTYAAVLPEGAATFYVRNGLGKLRRAERTPGDQKGELVRLKLSDAYPSAWSFPEDQITVPDDTRFCFAFGYGAPRDLAGSYPAVAPGLVFRADAGIGGLMQVTSALGAGHGGAPVFDPRGKLIGIAVGSGDILIDGKNLRGQVGKGSFALRLPGTSSPTRLKGPQPPMPAIEELYEKLSPSVVQLIAVR